MASSTPNVEKKVIHLNEIKKTPKDRELDKKGYLISKDSGNVSSLKNSN